jgi:hypothetical protein
MTYQAIISRIKVHSVEGAKTLSQGFILGYSVAVDNKTRDDSLVLFFPSDGQLSEEFAAANDLVYRGMDPVTGERLGGYFGPKRRVTSQKFFSGRIVSEGFACPLEFLAYTGIDTSTLKEGDAFDSLKGYPVCNKYITEATRKALSQNKKEQRYKDVTFPEHVETPQYKHVGHSIKPLSVVYITEKLHGTSGRMANVRVPVPNPWWKRLFGIKPRENYTVLHGSRRVILGEAKDVDGGYYGSNDFRYKVMNGVNLKPDEILYYEIVGYMAPGSFIMHSQDTKELGSKDMTKRWGPRMEYKYGCPDGTAKAFVYRITQNGVELSWDQVRKRARSLGLDTVPELDRFVVPDNDFAIFDKVIKDLTEGASVLDTKHIREGVCLRVENEDGVSFIKNKSVEFGILEGFIKNDETKVDIEEAA